MVKCVGLGYGTRLSGYTGLRTTLENKYLFPRPGPSDPDAPLAERRPQPKPQAGKLNADLNVATRVGNRMGVRRKKICKLRREIKLS